MNSSRSYYHIEIHEYQVVSLYLKKDKAGQVKALISMASRRWIQEAAYSPYMM